MLRRSICRFQSVACAAPSASPLSAAEDCIAAGSFKAALAHLSMLRNTECNNTTAPCSLSSSSPSPSIMNPTFNGMGHSMNLSPQFVSSPQQPPQSPPPPFTDYLRALCHLRLKEPLKARMALREELEHYPGNEDAVDLLARINKSLKDAFIIPQCIVDSEPLFAKVYNALTQSGDESLHGYAQPSWPRLFSLYNHAKELCEEGIQGDFVECGIEGAGTSVMLAVVAKHFGGDSADPAKRRRVIACDTFSGLDAAADAATSASFDALTAAFDVEVVKVSGAFDRTLPQLCRSGVIGDIALLHLDCDWYDSTKAAIGTLYPHVTRGGVIQVDDFMYWDGCRQAVSEHLERLSIPHTSLNNVDGNAVWMRKE